MPLLRNWLLFHGRRVGSLTRLAKQLGYASRRNPEFTAKLQRLIERKEVAIQQSGYVGDSMHHIKLVGMSKHAFQFLREKPMEREFVGDLGEPEKTVKPSAPCIAEWKPGGPFSSMVTTRGRRFFLKVPKSLVNYYRLKPGDWVKVRALQLMRLVTE